MMNEGRKSRAMSGSRACLWVVLLLLAACTSGDPTVESAGSPPAEAHSFPRQDTGRARFVLYHRQHPADAALASLQQVAATIGGGLRVEGNSTSEIIARMQGETETDGSE
jgi:hypothetical protein